MILDKDKQFITKEILPTFEYIARSLDALGFNNRTEYQVPGVGEFIGMQLRDGIGSIYSISDELKSMNNHLEEFANAHQSIAKDFKRLVDFITKETKQL